MMNKTSATLMLQTIMVLMDKQNSTLVTNFPSTFYEDAEIERCYSPYGCFSKAYPWTENRPDNYFPVSPETLGVRYAVFTRRNRKIPVLLQATDTTKIQNANLNPNGPFYFISHGFLEGGHKLWIQHMADALLNLQGNDAATVIIVDWRRGSQPPYGQAVANIRLVGVMTSYLIRNIYDVLQLNNLNNFHFIGHSLGAHLGGYCGHSLQKKFNLKLGRITGLDPAAPYFSNTVTLVRLDRSDAEYVDIIHSDAMPLYFSGFGLSEPIGHVDFYPNGGSSQPGCKNDAATNQGLENDMYLQVVKYVSCNHERSYELFTESVAPTCPFMAIQCKSYEAFQAGNCTTCDSKHLCVPMGLHSYRTYRQFQVAGLVDTNSNTALYALTGGTKPFCRVHYEVTLKVSNSTESRVHGPDVGRVSITLVDRNNNKSDHKFTNDEQKYYRPGDIETKLIAFKDTGHPPISVMVEWKYETSLLNPMTWRLLKSSSIYIEYIKISSIEYNTDITVCPKSKKPVVTNLPTVMKTKYCGFK